MIYEEVYNLLTKRLGLLSHREKAKKKKVFSDLEDSIKDTRKKWIDIKKKKYERTSHRIIRY